mmetsp:Transcript_7376/g.8883  ORF Transcript_7376/g.8883 Transcript_7376/m.8883 type:complete len:118 (-) Transcript_7376:102-455(-)
MENYDLVARYQIWFFVNAWLAIAAFIFKLASLIAIYVDNLWFFAMTQIFKLFLSLSAVIWFFLGAYWRYNVYGQLCAQELLLNLSKVLSICYYGGVILSLCFCSCYSCGTILYVSKE